jgi:hypothetical protein
MSTLRRAGLSFLLVLGLPSVAAPSDAPQPVTVRAFDASIARTRTYFIAAGASETEAVDFRLRLIDAGARNVNLFLPANLIVCDLPSSLDQMPDMPAGFQRMTAPDIESQHAFAHPSWSWIVDAYRTVDTAQAMTYATPGGETPFKDVVITTPPERIAEIERAVEKSRAGRGLAPRAPEMQDVLQSSAFLGGSISANFLFAESNGSLETELESWSDADLAAARQGAAEVMISWQGFATMDISFVLRFVERAETGYEPIAHTMRNDEVWMLDVLRGLGWGQGNDILAAVHEYNQARRAAAGTQWVFTAFIACSRNTQNHRFGNGTADYTAYAYLGGPCLVQPFPAGNDPNGVGERLVFSQIVNHEAGHCFWTLDEYPGAPGACGSASGYLNYANGNISTVTPGGAELRCNPMRECIMHSAARKNINPRPWCTWSQGHLGVIDNNGNGTPDIFEARPVINFIPSGADTILTNHYTLRFRVEATAVPNKNPNLAPDKRVSYAVPIEKVFISLGSGSKFEIDPIDGQSGGLVEEYQFEVDIAQVGMTSFSVEARNKAGYNAPFIAKVVYFVGVNFTRTGVMAKHNRNRVIWQIAGNPFGAKFDVYRLGPGEAMPGRLMHQNVGPSGPASGGFVPYFYDDLETVPGQDYRYYVEGRFVLPFDGGSRSYVSRSAVVGQTAMIPLMDDVISNIAPNPSRGPVTLSVSIPATFGGTERAPIRLATPVEVSIFSVNGKLVRKLTSGTSLQDVMTLRWDGNNERNQPMPSGIYFVRATAGSSKGRQKIVLLR